MITEDQHRAAMAELDAQLGEPDRPRRSADLLVMLLSSESVVGNLIRAQALAAAEEALIAQHHRLDPDALDEALAIVREAAKS